MKSALLSEVLTENRSGFWGSEPGEGDVDVRVVRNGDLQEDGVRWPAVPLRSVSLSEFQRAGLHRGDILITTSGDCGYSAQIETEPQEPTIASNFVRILRFEAAMVVPRFAFHFIHSEAFRRRLTPYIRGTALKNLVLSTAVERIEIPLPTLDEQRRIAQILDRADLMRAKRRAALAQVDTLTQSIFIDMFRDPASKGWRMSTVAGVAAPVNGAIRTGPFGSQLLHSEFTEAGIAVLGIDNAVENEFRWGERRFISQAKYERLIRYTVYPGDVLITIMGTCGRCAIVPDDIPLAISTKHVCCITLDLEKCLPEFLHAYFLRHSIARRYLSQKAKGAIMEGLNMGIIEEMPIPLAPLSLQRQLAGRLHSIEKVNEQQRASRVGMDALFASLQHRAFRGEL